PRTRTQSPLLSFPTRRSSDLESIQVNECSKERFIKVQQCVVVIRVTGEFALSFGLTEGHQRKVAILRCVEIEFKTTEGISGKWVVGSKWVVVRAERVIGTEGVVIIQATRIIVIVGKRVIIIVERLGTVEGGVIRERIVRIVTEGVIFINIPWFVGPRVVVRAERVIGTEGVVI